MTTVTRELSLAGTDREQELLLRDREWLVTNGLGGYASGTVGGTLTRRYHGLLISAYPAPRGRIVVLTRLAESVGCADGSEALLGTGQEPADAPDFRGAHHLSGFRLENGLPVWTYRVQETLLEKRIVMVHRRNTTFLVYRLLSGADQLRLKLRPELNFRPHDASLATNPHEPYRVGAEAGRYLVSIGENSPQLRLAMEGAVFTPEQSRSARIGFSMEKDRGYDFEGELWSPGYFTFELHQGRDAVLTATTEAWETIEKSPPERALVRESERRSFLLASALPGARCGLPAELVLAADQFIIAPEGRRVGNRSAGEEICSVIAGYPWFTGWGRDTMISLEGLTLVTGRHDEARRILLSFASYQEDGLIPNLFPEGDDEGLYHTADATLWFIHAVGRYLEYTGDRATLRLVLPQVRFIVERHLTGTRFGIGMDHGDGLLRQGARGCQLTWMDAKVEGWVVTPRRGKAVEINALWYNALRLVGKWCAEESDQNFARRLELWADRALRSFNERFWYRQGGYLYDVIDGESGDDPTFRPNQIFALSLAYPVLHPGRWGQLLAAVRERLLTRVGLRTLVPGHPDYRASYQGDQRARDAAYHQGTVWPWLIGPWVDAWLRLYPEQKKAARGFLASLCEELSEKCLGSVAEIYDAEEPHLARGCVAQAWSVAELLRSWVKTDSGEDEMGRIAEPKPDP